ncbi:MAG TPA: YdcF family protein [Terriglobales bacterium]|nr:YdcF family protein [Terriglobales bacterium]
MRKLIVLAMALLALLVFALNAGRILVVRDLRKADAILVLEGETDRRPALALELLRQGYAPRVLLDASSDARLYHLTPVQIAEEYIHTLPPEIAGSVSVCGMSALSTMEEAAQARRCLDAVGARSVLVVTSEYHTCRALSVFRHSFPDRPVSVAGARESDQFGVHWWRHRQWAKVTLGEWTRLIWWECVDRWR